MKSFQIISSYNEKTKGKKNVRLTGAETTEIFTIEFHVVFRGIEREDKKEKSTRKKKPVSWDETLKKKKIMRKKNWKNKIKGTVESSKKDSHKAFFVFGLTIKK